MLLARPSLGLLAGLLLLPGCYVTGHVGLGERLPAQRAVAALEPGVTTRAAVLQLLGPPDEFRQPAPMDALAAADSGARRVHEEQEVLAMRSFTWVRERHEVRVWLLWPLFVHRRTDTRFDRLKVLFDEHDRVAAVGCERGIEAP